MKRGTWIGACVALLVGLFAGRAAATVNSPPGEVPTVEVITMGPGEVLFERFGHAAICLRYPQTPRADTCFNYGTGDFSQPITLAWGFVQGRAPFWVATQSPDSMFRFYRRKDRTYYVQTLPLTEVQARKAESILFESIKEENKYYDYHHFRDNCTTRVRDVVDAATDGALRKGTTEMTGSSFRQMGRPGFAEVGWILLASDFLLGHPADEQTDRWKAMFLPDNLRHEIQTHLGVEPTILNVRQGRDFPTEESTWRGWVALLAAVMAGLIAAGARAPVVGKLGRGFSIFVLTLLGVVVWGLAVISSLPELRWNEVVLVLMPFDFLLATRLQERYVRVRLIGLGLVFVLRAVGVFTQALWVPGMLVLPVLLLLSRDAFRAPRKAAPAGAQPVKLAA